MHCIIFPELINDRKKILGNNTAPLNFSNPTTLFCLNKKNSKNLIPSINTGNMKMLTCPVLCEY